MTFEEFQQSGSDCSDLGNHPILQDDSLKGLTGRTYINSGYDCLYIERLSSEEWILTIANTQKVSPILSELERVLYDWAKDEGYFD